MLGSSVLRLDRVRSSAAVCYDTARDRIGTRPGTGSERVRGPDRNAAPGPDRNAAPGPDGSRAAFRSVRRRCQYRMTAHPRPEGLRMSPDNASPAWVLRLTAGAALLVGLDATVVSTALPVLRTDLHASSEELEWMVNAYVLSFAVLLMTAATLGERFGRRRLFTLGLGLFGAASVACALAPGAGSLIAARAVQGAGAAAVMPLALTLLTAAVGPAGRARALGSFTAVVGVSVPAGPLLGGAVCEGLSWRWIFWINVPAVAVLAVLILRHIPATRGPAVRLDLPGLGLSAAGVFTLVWALIQGNALGWTSARTLGALALGALLLAGFVRWEARTAHPMLPLGLFRSRSFTAGNVAIFLLWASTFGSVYFMAQYLQTALDADPLEAGLRLAPWGAMTAVVPRLAGILVARYGERPVLGLGMVLHGAAMLQIAAAARPGLPYGQLVPALVLSGTGVALAIPATQSAVMGGVAPQHLGRASGAFNSLRQLGGAFGVALLVAAFTASGGYDSARSFTDGFSAALAVSAAMAGLAAATALVIPGRARTRPVPDETIPAPTTTRV
ncbi:MFS transporter [Streptomyces sp. NPDC056169]|uniref:MFS transporter n=1 Tax=Streptomyces sp. NPDC056169 TaxID=3345734 RepID=UPI0035DB3979